MSALLLIDLQNDFLPGGSLGVTHGDQVVEVANRAMSDHEHVIATQDWHPPNHCSFASSHPGRQVGDDILIDGVSQHLWPVHCVAGTQGACFASDLDVQGIDTVIHKGTRVAVDSYSGFFDNARRQATGLDELLQRLGQDELHVMGLATDYCVRFTVLDAIELGYRVHLIREGVRGVDVRPGDSEQAIRQMAGAGAIV